MNRKKSDLIIFIIFIYFGLMVQILPKMLYGGGYFHDIMSDLLMSFGGIIIIAGFIMLFTNRSEKRIISSLNLMDELNQLGIDRVFNVKEFPLNEITDSTNSYQKVDMLISYNQVTKNIRYLIEQLVERKNSPIIRILVCGSEAKGGSDSPIIQQIVFEQRALSDVVKRLANSDFKNLSLRFSETNAFHSVIYTQNSICLFLPHEPSGRSGLVTCLNERSSLAISYLDLFESLWQQSTNNEDSLG